MMSPRAKRGAPTSEHRNGIIRALFPTCALERSIHDATTPKNPCLPRQFYVYILANRSGCLYVGVTGNMHRRWMQHRAGEGSIHCRRYHITRIVHVECASRAEDAIRREKQLKGWNRAKRVGLIQERNPEWRDLAVDWGWTKVPGSSGSRRVET